MYPEVEIKRCWNSSSTNIYVVVGGQVFQQSVGIPMGTNCAFLLANLFSYSYSKDLLLLPSTHRSIYLEILTVLQFCDYITGGVKTNKISLKPCVIFSKNAFICALEHARFAYL
jgi:hypothetical protein